MALTEEVKTYEFMLSELEVHPDKVLSLMGFNAENAMEPFPEMVRLELQKLKDISSIKGGFRILENVEVLPASVRIENIIFNTGKKVAHFLKNSTSVAVFACTAGEEISQKIRKYAQHGNSIESYVTDVLGSVIVETAMDKIHQILKKEKAVSGLNLTNRYSPGYCNWSVAEQFLLFDFLPTNFCGISLNKSALMQPIKSVSGIIGIGKSARFNDYLCDACNSKNCIYRGKN